MNEISFNKIIEKWTNKKLFKKQKWLEAKVQNNLIMKKIVGIIDYGMGNITSIQNILNYLGINSKIVTKNELNTCSHLILPGVGSFKKAMKNIKKLELIDPLKSFVYENSRNLSRNAIIRDE